MRVDVFIIEILTSFEDAVRGKLTDDKMRYYNPQAIMPELLRLSLLCRLVSEAQEALARNSYCKYQHTIFVSSARSLILAYL